MAKKTATENVHQLHPKTKVNLLSDVPAIQKYLWRIGAEAKSPRTATITMRVEGGYHHNQDQDRNDIATIKLAPDGTWHVPNSLAPTDAELEEIGRVLNDYQWPVLEKLPHPKLPKELADAQRADAMKVFEFRDTAGKVVMYQQRIEDKGGVGKRYIPWTFWDDGKWRKCEPDEALPLWGLEQLKHHSVVFLHEGAKAARHARKIASLRAGKGEKFPDLLPIEEREKLLQHPWVEELSHAAHLGWIGGAPNPHRTDWTPLKIGVHRIIIVADNETVGIDAVRKISRELGRWNVEVYDIRFDSRFPLSFDLADDFFAEESKGKLWEAREGGSPCYIGPSFTELLGPATWAVEEIPQKPAPEPKGRGRPKGPSFRLRDVFRNQWVIAKEMNPVVFVNRWDPSRLYREDNFNKKNRPFSGPVGNLSALMMGEHSVEIDLISYEPGRESKPDRTKAELIINGKRTFNTWTGTRVRPVTGKHYAPQPWLDFLEHLFPVEEERKLVMRWCATLIARPPIRMTFGLLLVSERHGIGKTTLAKVLSVLVGEHNTSWPSESQIVDSQFNSWLARKRLVVCNEIYSGHSWTAYKKLKSVISDVEVDVNEKHISQYTINNWAHVILCSNSDVPVSVEEDDRRIYQPQVTEKKKPPEWWIHFYNWLAGDGYGIILEWAKRHISKEKPIGPEEHPAMTETKRRLIEASMDDDLKLARSLGEQAMDLLNSHHRLVILVDRQVQSWVAHKLNMTRDRDSRAWKRSFANVRKGLRRSGMMLARQYRFHGDDYEAYANFKPEDGSDWKAKNDDATYWKEMNARGILKNPSDVETMINIDEVKAWFER